MGKTTAQLIGEVKSSISEGATIAKEQLSFAMFRIYFQAELDDSQRVYNPLNLKEEISLRSKTVQRFTKTKLITWKISKVKKSTAETLLILLMLVSNAQQTCLRWITRTYHQVHTECTADR